MIKEFAIGSVANRHHFDKSNTIESYYNSSKDMFHSLYDYDEYAVEFAKEHKKLSGFNGMVYMPDEFILDVDGKTPEEARQLTMGLLLLLNDLYVPYQVYFSGTGFHINIPRTAFRWKPSKDLHLMVKEALLDKGIFEFADVSVTDKTRLIRIPHTMNMKSRLWKTPITDAELSGSIEDIQELAKKPRRKFEYKILECGTPAFDAVTKKKKAKTLNRPANSTLGYKPDPYNYPCIQTLMSGVAAGQRHAVALRIASHIRLRYPENVVRIVMEDWRQSVSSDDSPFTEKEMENIIKSSYEGHNGQGNNYGCQDPIKDKYCKETCFLYKAKKSNKIMNSSSLEKQLANFHTRNVEPLQLGEMCNQDFPVYPGEVVVIQAPPKSMKTMFLLNVANYFKKRTFFLEMEMSPKQMMERLIMIEKGWTKQQIIDHYRSFQNGMDKLFEWINFDFEACYVGELTKRINLADVKPEVVIVDHMGLMKSTNNDPNSRNEGISQGLMDLARHNDLIVFTVTEISKHAIREGMDIASSKGSIRTAYNANKILSITPYKKEKSNIIKSLHVECTANRESEDMNAYFQVNGAQITG